MIKGGFHRWLKSYLGVFIGFFGFWNSENYWSSGKYYSSNRYSSFQSNVVAAEYCCGKETVKVRIKLAGVKTTFSLCRNNRSFKRKTSKIYSYARREFRLCFWGILQ